MRKRICAIGLLVFLCAAATRAALAQTHGCTVEKMKQAEKETDNLKSWELVYEFYETYSRCDDGGVAEGVSDKIAKLLANHWSSVAEFVSIANNDKKFEKFVLRHVDATIDWEHDGPKIHENAQLHCPVNLKQMCRELMARSTPPRDMGPK